MIDSSEPEVPKIAIIGMSGRFPGAGDIQTFWQNLKNGVDALQRFSDEELGPHLSADVLKNPNFIKAGYVLDDIDRFDAEFFNISGREAELIDPQQRLFLECSWEALENAGYVGGSFGPVIGVYASASMSTYFLNLLPSFTLADIQKATKVLLGNDKDYIATRVCYKLGLTGPGVVVQSACSSSLVAICMACQSLLDYQTDIALAGGATIDVPSKHGYLYQEGNGAVSRDSRCRAFDDSADGIGTGNGVGVVVLKRLDEALRDKDFIYAVIRGFGLNNDGARKVGFTAPSVQGQQEAIAEAIAMAGVGAETISYVEAHGTGTELGDPIELAALTKGYAAGKGKPNSCAIGSVKTNIGHLNVAAGVASVIKTALSLHHRTIPPSLHFEKPNRKIDFAASPFYVNTETREWKNGDLPLRAGVSSFGLGGTNAHVILEEAPEISAPEARREWYLVPLSARTETALERASRNLSEHLTRSPALSLADVAYTLLVGRKRMAHRKVMLCRSRQDVMDLVAGPKSSKVLLSDRADRTEGDSVKLMFPGVGGQYLGMGRGLYDSEPVFREAVNGCARALTEICDAHFLDALYARSSPVNGVDPMTDPRVALTGIFVTEYALAKLLQSWGVKPSAMIGHSLGEYVAATLSGVFSVEDALSLVVKRGELVEQIPEGGMIAVLSPEETIAALLNESLSVGAVNGPSLCVVAGLAAEIDRFQERLKSDRIPHRRLPAGRAGHCSLMDPILDQYRDAVRKVRLSAPSIPLVSNVTGTWLTEQEAVDPEYWVRHLRNTVRFSAGLQNLFDAPGNVFLEVGPGKGLTTLAERHSMKRSEQRFINCMRDGKQDVSDTFALTKALGNLWLAGAELDWQAALYPDARRKRVPLPTYPFERKRYFIERDEGARTSVAESSPSKRADVSQWFYAPSWKRTVFVDGGVAMDQTSTPRQTWLVFVDGHGLGSDLSTLVRQAGDEVVVVGIGDCFKELAAGVYQLNPGCERDYEMLVQHLMKNERIPDRIAHLWSVSSSSRTGDALTQFEAAQDLGYKSLIYLMRAFTAASLSQRTMTLGVISTNLQSVTGMELLSPEKVTVLGPCKVIPVEFPTFASFGVDVELEEGGTQRTARALVAEFARAPAELRDQTTVAYRGKHRWVQCFESAPIDAPDATLTAIRERGVYLITGGLGGVGYILAEHLAKAYRAKLVLVGRSEMPERATWDHWLGTHDEQQPVVQRIRKAQRLEELGAEVLAIGADVGDPNAMRAAFERAIGRFGSINGIIHAAGVEGGGLIELRELDGTNSNMPPKIRGTLILDELVGESKLDFFMLCSSLVSFTGTIGGVDYTASNLFLDAYANRYQQRFGGKLVSVNWDYWMNVGMAVNLIKRHQSIFKSTIDAIAGQDMIETISPDEGVDAFARILGTKRAQVMVSTRDFPKMLVELRSKIGAMRGIFDTAKLETRSHPRPKLATPYVAPRNEAEQIVVKVWGEVLGIENIGVDDSYFDIGGDSLHAMPLIAKLQELFQIDLPLKVVYSQDTPAKQASFMAESSAAKKSSGGTTSRPD